MEDLDDGRADEVDSPTVMTLEQLWNCASQKLKPPDEELADIVIVDNGVIATEDLFNEALAKSAAEEVRWFSH